MSPVDDPRFSGAHRTERIQQQREESERQTRLEYIKPLLMLALGAQVLSITIAPVVALGLWIHPSLLRTFQRLPKESRLSIT